MVNENRLHELYKNLQNRLASDLDAARNANKNANAKGDESALTWLRLFDAAAPLPLRERDRDRLRWVRERRH